MILLACLTAAAGLAEAMTVSDQTIKTTILRLVDGRDDGKSICPSEVARDLAGNNEKEWRLLMKPIRRIAVDLAVAGEIEIARKGKTVDPADFRGVYRLRRPQGAG